MAEEPERTNPFLSKSVGKADTKSRAKAESAADRQNKHVEQAEPGGWPLTPDGRPMVKILMTASELIPTGQYANVAVGPAQITAFVDPNNDQPFTDEQKANIAKGLNELAEIVEGDVVAVQRNLVLESMQEQVSSNGS